jgi:hypothetical protein
MDSRTRWSGIVVYGVMRFVVKSGCLDLLSFPFLLSPVVQLRLTRDGFARGVAVDRRGLKMCVCGLDLPS